MTRIVVDASVVVKWYLAEPHSDSARALLRSGYEFVVPDLLFAELANVAVKTARRGAITADEAALMVDLVWRGTFVVHPVQTLAGEAFHAAMKCHISAYDACYVTLAKRLGTHCVTADRKLYEAVKKTPLRDFIAWIADEPLFLM
jgi:predicted nucleic acid-binding protein